MAERHDLVIVGGGAAGLMAAIAAGRAGRPALVLDGAKRIGAKILVSGGGRCNVTHDVVDERGYFGSTPGAIRSVLRRFDAADTVAFFAELGVALRREETGKLFPVDGDARVVLDALLRAARRAGAEIRHPWRVGAVRRRDGGFVIEPAARPAADAAAAPAPIETPRLVLATGGRSLPKSGSDGAGIEIARALGHAVTPRLLPALVGLVLAPGHYARTLAGISADARLEVRAASGRRLEAIAGAALCTHFGLSGPAPMDVSRAWQHAVQDDPGARLVVSWLPGERAESLDAALRDLRDRTPGGFLAERLPARLARAICEDAGVDPATPGHVLSRAQRRALVAAALEAPLPVTGTRGWNHAEATAGGVPLAEIRLDTMASRRVPGLFLCGEMLDVDGRIGGYNFQWAWSSGHLAGRGAAAWSPPAP